MDPGPNAYGGGHKVSTKSERQAPSIFVSYRIADTLPIADRLAAELKRSFGPEAVFFDRRTIEPGDAWDAAISSCGKGRGGGTRADWQENGLRNRTNTVVAGWTLPAIGYGAKSKRLCSMRSCVIPVLVDGASPPRGRRLLTTSPALRRDRKPPRDSASHNRVGHGLQLTGQEACYSKASGGLLRPAKSRESDHPRPCRYPWAGTVQRARD